MIGPYKIHDMPADIFTKALPATQCGNGARWCVGNVPRLKQRLNLTL